MRHLRITCLIVTMLGLVLGFTFLQPIVYAATGTISANPNPVYVPYGSSSGTTTITWSASGTTAQVWVSMDGAPETNFTTGKSGSQAAPWIQPGHVYVFKLYDGTSHTPPALASVTVNGLRPTGTISSNPWTDAVAASGSATATITWAITGYSNAQVWISMDGAAETNFATGPSGSQAAPWIQPGHWYEFRLYQGTTHTYRLASVRVYGRTIEYQAGVNYHATGSPLDSTAFLAQYHLPGVRTLVQSQLQGMANRGATVLKTNIWLVSTTTNPFPLPAQAWKFHFPPSAQELANLRLYAQDVAAIVATDGHRLKLDIALLPQQGSDYHQGTPGTNLGSEHISAADMLSRWTTSYTTVINNTYDINRPDGQKVVGNVYLMWEVMVTAKPNEEWFLTNEWPGFVTFCGTKGVTPQLYFASCMLESEILSDGWVDPQYPVMNGHRSMFYLYRSLKYISDNNLPIPARIDFSCYLVKVNSTYAILAQRVFDDADAVLPTLIKYNADLTVKSMVRKYFRVVECNYLLDNTQRETLGDAYCAQRNINNRLTGVEFWTVSDGGGPGIDAVYPFEIEDYLP